VGQVFNVGNGAEVSIRDLAKRVIAMTGSRSPIQFVPYHEVFGHGFEDMSRRVPDLTKIQRLVGYQPTVHLDEILTRVIEFWTPPAVTSAPVVCRPTPLHALVGA
jgi:UDP-glucose 4-epimerase